MTKVHLFTLCILGLCSLGLYADCPDWDQTRFKAEIGQLTQQIRHWDQAYFEHGTSLIEDNLYDQTRQFLAQWSACINMASLPATPPTSQRYTQTHPYAQSGLRKLNDNEVRVWLENRTDIWAQPKVDGVAVSLVYEQGQLSNMISRGDGQLGQSWLQHAQSINAIPKQLYTQRERIHLQGELYLQQSTTTHNARSTVAGWMNRKQLAPELANRIGLFIWEWPDGPRSMPERLHELEALGFTAKQYTHPIHSFADAQTWRAFWHSNTTPFATDGIVLRQGQRPAEQLRQPYPPTWAIAWKHPASQHLAEVRAITFNVGRSGRITPIVHIRTTIVEGKTIRKLSLGSLKQFHSMDLAIGDHISLRLSGQSIPQLIDVVYRSPMRKQVIAPNPKTYHALSCWSLSDGCEQQFLARLTWLSGKQGLQLTGLNRGTWAMLVEQGKVNTLGDWLGLKAQDLKQLKGFGQQRAQNISQQIEFAKQQPFSRWLQALDAPYELRLRTHDSWHALSQLSMQDWQQRGYSHASSQRLVEFFSHAPLQQLAQELSAAGVVGF